MRKKIHVIGVPWDNKSSFMRGCADAPYKIWDAFNCDSANTCTESGFNLNCGLGAVDLYAGIDNENWAENEFVRTGIVSGDRR